MINSGGNHSPIGRHEFTSLQQAGFTVLYRHRYKMRALTSLFSPLPYGVKPSGSFVSVALSLGFPPVAVSNCLSLCCPDFPLVLDTSDQPIIWLIYHYTTYGIF